MPTPGTPQLYLPPAHAAFSEHRAIARIGQGDGRIISTCQQFTVTISGLTWRTVCGSGGCGGINFRYVSGVIPTATLVKSACDAEFWGYADISSIQWQISCPTSSSFATLFVRLYPLYSTAGGHKFVLYAEVGALAFYAEFDLCNMFSGPTGLTIPNQITSLSCVTLTSGLISNPAATREVIAHGGSALLQLV